VGGDSGPVKDRYRDSGDEESKISSWGKAERIAANDSAFRRVWCSVKKLLADARHASTFQRVWPEATG
jgi:hypothetical protein